VIAEDELLASPAWFPLRLARPDGDKRRDGGKPDGGKSGGDKRSGGADQSGGDLAFVNLDEAAYASASFLDERILALNRPQATCRLVAVRAAAATLAPRAHYIFHTGHVGSTLISRLIGAHASFFSLREPALLRELATGNSAPDAALDLKAVLALLSRTWRPGQRAVIKATSFVNELAGDMLALSDQAVAIMMYASPANYLRGILGGPNSRVESRSLAPSRLGRLVRRLGTTLQAEPRSEGEQIAMSWLCEMAALHQVAQRFPSRVLWVDFDLFLREPVKGSRAVFRALGVDCAVPELEALVASPIMQQYSKAPEHSYDAALRREVLALADWEHQAEIRQGMDWLQREATSHPLVTAIVKQIRA
jgi:hypothetical protein